MQLMYAVVQLNTRRMLSPCAAPARGKLKSQQPALGHAVHLPSCVCCWNEISCWSYFEPPSTVYIQGVWEHAAHR